MEGGVKVLVVEDFEQFRQFTCSLLRESIECRLVGEASDGLEAVQKIEELRPDLILLDIALPKLNGIEVAKQARMIVPHAKLLFISQESSSDIIEETFRVGGQGYVHKTYVQNDLLPAIEAVLRGQVFVSEGLGFIEGSRVSAISDRFNEISASLMRLSTLPDLLDGILDAGIEIAGADFGNIQFCNLEGSTLKMVAHRGLGPKFVKYFEVVHYGAKCVCGTALRDRKQIIVEDVSTDPTFNDTEARTVMLNASARACQSTPLFTRSGELFGILNTHHSRAYRPPDSTLQLLERFAHQAAEHIKRFSSQP